MVKNLKPSSANYKLRTTNYREKGPYDAAIRLRTANHELFYSYFVNFGVRIINETNLFR